MTVGPQRGEGEPATCRKRLIKEANKKDKIEQK